MLAEFEVGLRDGSVGIRHPNQVVENLVGLFADSGVEVVPLHVLGPATMPHYWDQPAHEPEVWGTEFLRRLWHAPRAPLQPRSGAVGRQILDAVQVLDIDLIVLAWTQHLDPGRSRVLRDVIAASTVPVLVVPIRKLDGSAATLMLQRTGPHRNRPRGEPRPATEPRGQL